MRTNGLRHPRQFGGRRSWRFAAILCTAVLLAPVSAAPAQGTDWKQGKLGHLSQYIGTYRYDAALGDPAVRAELETLAGPDAAVIIANLDVASPIAFIDGHLVLRGNASHQGGLEEALVLIKVFDGTVRAALLHDRRMKLYARDAEYAYVPRELREFLRPRPERPEPAALPPNVEWVGGPRR